VLYLMEIEKLTLQEGGASALSRLGLLGVSGISSEPRVILRHVRDSGEAGERARIALDLFVRRIVREIGSLVAALGGLDMLVFTAGIGEHSEEIRARVCADLAWLGLGLDDQANAAHAPVISSADSRVLVGVELTNEEWPPAIRCGFSHTVFLTRIEWRPGLKAPCRYSWRPRADAGRLAPYRMASFLAPDALAASMLAWMAARA
jgi:acetate kinase